MFSKFHYITINASFVPNKILSDHLEWNMACYFTETSRLNWVIWVVYSRISRDVKFAYSLQHRSGLNATILSRLHPVLICFILITKITQSHIVTKSFQALSQNCEKWLLAPSQLSVRLTVCLSVRPHRTTRLPLDGFSWSLIFEYCSKMPRKRRFL